jgi:hypothetical protein
MILPEITVPELVGLTQDYYATDNPKRVYNHKHFRNYPHKVDYCFNSRGFRDSEWPISIEQLEKSIWCVGDSATVGVGNPIEHTWVYMLAQKTGRRAINVSMIRASNNWISRKAKHILQQINPTHMVIQWSFFSRRESDNLSLSDLDRQIHHDPRLELSVDIENFKACLQSVESIKGNTVLIHSIIPDAFAGISEKEIRTWWNTHKQHYWPDQIPKSWTEINERIQSDLRKKDLLDSFYWHYHMQNYMQEQEIILLDQLHENSERELARDGFHYDIKTAKNFVDQIWKRVG